MNPSATYHPGWRDGLTTSATNTTGQHKLHGSSSEVQVIDDDISRLLSPIASSRSTLPGINLNQLQQQQQPEYRDNKWNSRPTSSGSNNWNTTHSQQQWQPVVEVRDSSSSSHQSRGSTGNSIWANPTTTTAADTSTLNALEEESRFLSQMNIGTNSYFDNPQNQPPKQPVRRPSYNGYNDNSYNNNQDSSSSYPSFLPSNSQDSNNSIGTRTTGYNYSQTVDTAAVTNNSSSSLQQAASSFYPASVTSTIPGLVGASSGSTASVSLYQRGPVVGTTSSLAAAAAAGRNLGVQAPPPGFGQERRSSAGNSSSNSRRTTVTSNNNKTRDGNGNTRQRTNNRKKGSGSSSSDRTSPPALKDRSSNCNVQQHQSFSAYTGGADMKDDMTTHSVTSTTTATTATSYRSYQPVQETAAGSSSSSQAIRALMEPERQDSIGLLSASSFSSQPYGGARQPSPPILPQPVAEDYFLALERDMERDQHHDDTDTDGGESFHLEFEDDEEIEEDDWSGGSRPGIITKKREWLQRMNRKLAEIPVGELDPATVPLSAIMNAWAKTKSAQGAAMVELWLKRAQEESEAGNRRVVSTTKMYTMAGTCLSDRQ
jgi:hypothetical protein